ncbi:Tyrosine kinase receptor Cad96Ca [Operophtera brumata]|uniref:Tyrosine kinase receptor Cad96Ca n=1 Tax=Operophtera brumata TaxID=104452 RepID=A0A0L7KML5_OPEBR|nr:Tyrosine kinase receptor Cad96Ca [Operophtera brumata]
MLGSARRTTTQSSVNGTRDSQLLSLLAARRRQLLSERLATHVNTLASLAHKTTKDSQLLSLLAARRRQLLSERLATYVNTLASLAHKTTKDSQLLSLLAAKQRQLLSKRLATYVNTLASLAHKTTKDSQLLSLLAARWRQLLSERLAAHVNTLASLGHKTTKTNTTFAQLEIRDSNSSLVRTLTYDNTSSESTPTLKLITSDGTKEVQQEVKPHEIRHLFIPKYSENRTRAGFVNNRRKPLKAVNLSARVTEPSIIYVPPDKLEEFEKEIDIDPDEEFQVDESNHGLYLLNYSDTENITQNPDVNITTTASTGVKDNVTTVETTTASNESKEVTTVKQDEEETNTIANSTDNRVKIENEKDKDNQTLFMSEEIYNHFRPLETELPGEDMAPFKYFGQKIGGAAINDNLTNSPSLSASTKSVIYFVAPSDKRKFNSRYSATEKYKNTSADEEEINEDMDVSVVKNVIEKNKIRNTVKGPAPARHVGLINAYRKYSSSTPASTKAPNIAQLNVTDPIVPNFTPAIDDSNKRDNRTSNATHDVVPKLVVGNFTKEALGKTVSTPGPRNFTRTYSNLRRKPANRVAASTINENIVLTAISNTTTTEKASTVYTAVVTSVSITSSVKGQNKTDPLVNDADTNATIPEVLVNNDNSTTEIDKIEPEMTTTSKPTSSSTVYPPSSPRYRHKIRIRTTTLKNSYSSGPTANPLTSEIPRHLVIKNETISRISDRLASLYGHNENTTSSNITIGTPIRTKDILKRRRPTTTPSTTTMFSEPTIYFETIPSSISPYTEKITTTENLETTQAFRPIITSRIASESSSVPKAVPRDSKLTLNSTIEKEHPISNNEEVVIEADKTYTASYVLAGLGFLPVAAIIAFVLRSVLNKKTKEIDTEYEGYFDDGGDIKKESPITPVARPPIPTPSKPDTKWEFPRNKLRLQTLLGQGNFGQTRLVAVKSIKETASQKEKQELLHEILIMQKIGTHPNVVTLLACCTEQEPYLLIMEYVMCGKLLTYLRERRSRPDRFSGSGALTSRDLTVFAYCVARGMDYIASKGIVHRDLAARNVLVDHNKLCKIADFGMSRSAGAAARAPRGALPVRWMAPEALLYNSQRRSTPYAAMSGREVLTAVTEGYRLERPPHCKPQLYRAMHTCWHADPSQRPSFASLKAQLAELLDNEPSEGNYVDLDSFYQESSVYSDPSAIINDDEGLSAEYDRERRCFRDERNFSDGEFNERTFPDKNFNDRNFTEKNYNDRNFSDKNFIDTNFTERKDGKLSTSSFHRERERERERENPVVSRNSFNGFPRIGTRDNHFQMSPDGRNKRVSEFECDI